jgi:hypothetical protein
VIDFRAKATALQVHISVRCRIHYRGEHSVDPNRGASAKFQLLLSPLPPPFNDFPLEVIDAERPDVVIYDRWERAMLLSPYEWAEITHLPPAR